MTTIFNLATGEERTYDLSPKSALIAAYNQTKGDYNTWNYNDKNYHFIEGEKTIALGDWCVIKK